MNDIKFMNRTLGFMGLERDNALETNCVNFEKEKQKVDNIYIEREIPLTLTTTYTIQKESKAPTPCTNYAHVRWRMKRKKTKPKAVF